MLRCSRQEFVCFALQTTCEQLLTSELLPFVSEGLQVISKPVTPKQRRKNISCPTMLWRFQFLFSKIVVSHVCRSYVSGISAERFGWRLQKFVHWANHLAACFWGNGASHAIVAVARNATYQYAIVQQWTAVCISERSPRQRCIHKESQSCNTNKLHLTFSLCPFCTRCHNLIVLLWRNGRLYSLNF